MCESFCGSVVELLAVLILSMMKIVATETADQFLPDLAALVAKQCQRAIAKKGTFTVAISGG